MTTITKATNPKEAVASCKPKLSIIPLPAMTYMAEGLTNGMMKYGLCNWRVAGVRASVYVDAAIRHLMCWKEGENVDPDDQVPNLAGALASIAILVDSIENGMITDDRPTPMEDPRAHMKDSELNIKRLKQLREDQGHNPEHNYITVGKPQSRPPRVLKGTVDGLHPQAVEKPRADPISAAEKVYNTKYAPVTGRPGMDPFIEQFNIERQKLINKGY